MNPISVVEAKSGSQENESVQTFTLADFDYQTDYNFQCVNAEKVFGITFPGNWQFSDPALLSINFSHSELLNPLSTLSIEWNGVLLGTAQLTEDNMQLGTLEISIPAAKINPGYNALTISFFMGITDNFYEDYKNQSIWAVIHNDTSIEVSPEIVARETELSIAPEILVDSSLLAENNITLLIPDSPSLQHLNALAVMSTKLGQLADWRNINVQIMTISETKKTRPSGNLILFATVEEIEDFSTTLLPEINEVYNHYADYTPLAEDDGLISFQESPFDSLYHVLILTGSTYNALEKSARAAAFDELYKQSDGTWAVVRNLTIITDPISDPLAITLSDLGYSDQTVTGTQESTIQYSLPISALWKVDSEAWIDLYFNHSELISKDLSSVSVLVNSVPVASFDLNNSNAEDGYEEIRIPLRYLDIGENIIAFNVNMEFSEDYLLMQDSCVPETSSRASFSISSETGIRFPDVANQISLDLNNFPYSYSDPYTFDGFAFGVPGTLDIEGVSGLVDIAVTIGKATYGNPAAIDLNYVDEDLSPFTEYSYIILLGTTETLLNESLNEVLPLQVDQETGLLQNDTPLLVVETSSRAQSFLQTFLANQSTTYLVLISDGMEGIAMAGEFLANPDVRYTLQGNVAIITSTENATAYQIDTKKSSPENFTQLSTDEPLAFLSNFQSIWIIRVAIGVGVFSVIVILIALLRKKPSSTES